MIGYGVFKRIMLLLAAIGSATLLLVGTAYGQGMDSASLQAEEEFLKGVSAYESGDFQTAILSFQRSFRFKHRPNLAFNIAMSFESLKDMESAAAWYRQYRSLKSIDELGIEQRLQELGGASQGVHSSSSRVDASPSTMNPYQATAFGVGVFGVVTASVLGSMALYYSGRSEETANLTRQGVYARNAEGYAITTDVTLVLSIAALLYGGTSLFDSSTVSQ
jgi:hypothetical protein